MMFFVPLLSFILAYCAATQGAAADTPMRLEALERGYPGGQLEEFLVTVTND